MLLIKFRFFLCVNNYCTCKLVLRNKNIIIYNYKPALRIWLIIFCEKRVSIFALTYISNTYRSVWYAKPPHQKNWFFLFKNDSIFKQTEKIPIFFLQKCSKLHERCGMCWKKWKIEISDFYFSSYGHFCTQNHPKFRWIFTLTREKKIRKIRKLIFHSIQHIAHLSLKPEQNWGEGGKGVCISLVGKQPKFKDLLVIQQHTLRINEVKAALVA